MQVGDTVKTELGVGEIVEEEICTEYTERRFGVKIDSVPGEWFEKQVMFFFESHLEITKI